MFDAPTLAALLHGYLTSLSLILAIGAQNAFVLRQGIRREHEKAAVFISRRFMLLG